MTESQIRKTHLSVWIVGVISLLWHLGGCANYVMQAYMSDDMLTRLSPAQLAIIQDRPAWVTAAFAIAVFTGLIASILLLLRKSSALMFFVAALIGVIVSMIPVFGIVNSGVPFTMVETAMYLVLTPMFGAFLVWYTRYAIGARWIGTS